MENGSSSLHHHKNTTLFCQNMEDFIYLLIEHFFHQEKDPIDLFELFFQEVLAKTYGKVLHISKGNAKPHNAPHKE